MTCVCEEGNATTIAMVNVLRVDLPLMCAGSSGCEQVIEIAVWFQFFIVMLSSFLRLPVSFCLDVRSE